LIILGIALALAMDALAVSIGLGLSLKPATGARRSGWPFISACSSF
jgi:putative Mn2+ efflux pump MntP